MLPSRLGLTREAREVPPAPNFRDEVVHSRTQRPELLKLIGMHGALTAEETRVPLLTVPGRRVG
jgi:hypothetical protein